LALDPSLIRPIDVATLNGKPFINVAVAGGLAEVPADELSSRWKRLLGPVAIAFYGGCCT
jgi:diacylglycerol kinase family enzyme